MLGKEHVFSQMDTVKSALVNPTMHGYLSSLSDLVHIFGGDPCNSIPF